MIDSLYNDSTKKRHKDIFDQSLGRTERKTKEKKREGHREFFAQNYKSYKKGMGKVFVSTVEKNVELEKVEEHMDGIDRLLLEMEDAVISIQKDVSGIVISC